MWNEEFISVLYYIESSDSGIYLQDLLLILNDEKIMISEEVGIEHLVNRESNDSLCPTAYVVNEKGKDFYFKYRAKTVMRKKIETWGYPEDVVKSWAPNFSFPLIFSEGAIKRKGNDKNILGLKGKGILEFVHVNSHPFKKPINL